MLSLILHNVLNHQEAFAPMLVLALAQAGYSLYGAMKSQQQLDELDKEGRPKYKVSPELQNAYNEANMRRGQGFSGAETANFRQGIAQDINTQAQRALDMGGGSMARTISKMGSIANLGAESRFAAQNEAIRRQNTHYADQLAREIQGVNDREAGAGVHDYNLKQQAFGAAHAQNMSNIFSSLAMAGQYAGKFGNKTTDFNAVKGTGDPIVNSFGNYQQAPQISSPAYYGNMTPELPAPSNYVTDPNQQYNGAPWMRFGRYSPRVNNPYSD